MLEISQSSSAHQRLEDLRRAIQLAEQAIALCDRHDFAFAAISLSEAIEKLKVLEGQSRPTNG